MDEESKLQTTIDELVAGISTEENFQRLVQRFQPSLLRFFSRLGLVLEESQDLTQETFLRIYSSISAYRREARFEGWLFSIATNIFRQHLRRRSAAKRKGQEMPLDETMAKAQGQGSVQLATFLEVTPVAHCQDPESALLLDERTRHLFGAVQSLPDRMRQCLIMRSYQELSYEDIAVALQLSPETVRSHLFQARRRLREKLNQDSGHPAANGVGGENG